jgi:hypothetical protein
MNEEERILTIRVRNVCKDMGADNLSVFASGLIEYALEHGGTDTISGLPRICSGSNCIVGKTCKRCWGKEFDKLQEGGEPLL